MNKRFQVERKSSAVAGSGRSGKWMSTVLLMLVVLMLGGCSTNTAAGTAENADTSAQSETAAKATEGTSDSTGNTTENGTGQPGSGTQKGSFTRADLMGEVKSIVGNSLTLALAKVPTREAGTGTQGATPPTGGEMPSGGGTPPEGGGAPFEGAPSGTGGQEGAAGGSTAKSGGSTASSGQTRPSGGASSGTGNQGGGGQGGFGGSGSTGTRRAMNLTLTGETKELLIPVGVSITSGNGDNAKTIDIADIEKGDVLMIYYVEGTEDIEKITVR